jgi:hypothetical protein
MQCAAKTPIHNIYTVLFYQSLQYTIQREIQHSQHTIIKESIEITTETKSMLRQYFPLLFMNRITLPFYISHLFGPKMMRM